MKGSSGCALSASRKASSVMRSPPMILDYRRSITTRTSWRRLASSTGKLRLRRVTIVTLGLHELAVGTALHDAAAVEDDDAVALAERTEAMSDHQRSATFHCLLHRGQNLVFRVRVDCCRRIVEQENGR